VKAIQLPAKMPSIQARGLVLSRKYATTTAAMAGSQRVHDAIAEADGGQGPERQRSGAGLDVAQRRRQQYWMRR
jgi:hypothetical protein